MKHLLTGLLLCLPIHTLCVPLLTTQGIVKADNGFPIEYATVTLLNASDSTLITGTVTDSLGSFSINHDYRPSIMRVSALGYIERFLNNPRGNIGEIFLESSVTRLGEVVVKGQRPMAKIKGDGIQLTVSDTYLATTGTALDLLGKMPFVTRDRAELAVIGKGTPLIYLNGREIRDISEIEQLPSSSIRNVEVITNPGARYASTVNSVIRITTLAPVGEGFSASDRTTVGYKHYLYLFEQVNLNYRHSGLDLFGMLNYENYRERPAYDNHTVQYLTSGTVNSDNRGSEFSKYPVYQGKIGFNYNMTAHNFGLYYDFSYRPADIRSWSTTERFLNSVLYDNLAQSYDGHRRNRQHLVSAYYQGCIGKWELSANFDAIRQINGKVTDEQETSTANPSRVFSTVNDVTNRLIAGNVIASFPAWKGNIRFGSEISDIHRTDMYSSDADFISYNDTRINESTYALFAEAFQRFGVVELSAGLRWEHTATQYYLFDKKQYYQSRSYNNLAPSAGISLPVGNISTRLNYSRKTTRPAFEQLSSAIRYIDRYSYESGNPALQPIYRDYLSLSASWKGLVVEMDFTSTKNYFMWQTKPYPGFSDATLLTMENMPRFNSYSVMVNYSRAIGCWRPDIMAALQYQDFSVNHNGRELKLDRPIGMFRLNNAIHLPLEIWLNVDFSSRTSGDGDNFYMKGFWTCDLGLYKSFANETWSIKLQLNDLFDTWRQEFISYDAVSSISARKLLNTRDLSLSLRYNFNPARSRYKGRGAANSDKSRL